MTNKKKEYSPAQIKAIRRSYAIKANKSKKGQTVKPAKPPKGTLDMRLAVIRGRYLYGASNPQETHTYAVYTDPEAKEVRAVQTTHLYVPDKINMERLHKGLLAKVKFAGYETPSGVSNQYFNTSMGGKPIDLNHADVVSVDKTPLPQAQAQKIRAFAKYRRENK